MRRAPSTIPPPSPLEIIITSSPDLVEISKISGGGRKKCSELFGKFQEYIRTLLNVVTWQVNCWKIAVSACSPTTDPEFHRTENASMESRRICRRDRRVRSRVLNSVRVSTPRVIRQTSAVNSSNLGEIVLPMNIKLEYNFGITP